jgi:hypothetical protein
MRQLLRRDMFCFFGDNLSGPGSTRGILEFLPFNEDLNRFSLVVTNGGAAHYKVTWGNASKVFDAVQLQHGINLAAEFLDNPFVEAFTSVDKSVREQQSFETPAVKSMLHSLPDWETNLPDEKETLNNLKDKTTRKADDLCKIARETVVPVKHELLIEPVS